MANNRNSNQPRRKRNKKPVKRYSEEYSNRPNPYTGYSADGNFHPEAKKHTLEDASVAPESAVEAVINTDEQENDALIGSASETASVTENESVTEGNEKNSGRRKKNIDREAEKKAQQAKTEARRAAVSKIAQGVAAHSVSEQIIEDIASMSDVMESMAKAGKDRSDEEEASLTDAYEDLIAAESEEALETEDDAAASDDAVEEPTEIALPVILGDDDVLPFDADADESTVENTQEPIQEISEEECDSSEDEASDDAVEGIHPLNPADLIPVLDFDKPPAPVLDFDKPSAPVLDLSEPIKDESSDEQEEVVTDELVSKVTIEEILAAVEKENLSTEAPESVAESREFSFGSVIFDTTKSEDWDSVIIPPDTGPEETEEESDDYSDGGNADLSKLLEACFSSDDEIADTSEDENAEGDDIFTLSDDGEIAAEVLSDINSEMSENEYSAEDMFDITDDISEIAAEAFGDDDDNDAQRIEATFDIAEDDVTETASEETEIVSVEDEDQDSIEQINQTEAAVNAKLQKLVEAAELAELLRLENEEIETIADDSEHSEKLNSEFVFNSEQNDESQGIENLVCVEAGEDVREYPPKAVSAQQEDVFESVLIVDDSNSDSVSDDENENQDDSLFLREKTSNECPTAVFKLPEGPIILPTDIDDGDFQEQWLDDEGDSDEMVSRSKRARRRMSAFIGAVTILIVSIGTVWALKTAVMGINSIGSTGEKKAEYTQFISPVVITDPQPFESIEGADNQMLLESAIWSVLDSAEDASDFKYDDTGKIVLPAKEVEEAGKKLFGSDVKLNMDVLSENDGNVLYYYDSIEDNFHIATSGIIGPSAVITKIAQKSDYVSLIVGYCSQADMSSASSDTNEAYKYMEYILSFDEAGEYHIESIRDYVEE